MIRPEDVAEIVRCLLRLSPACIVPEVMMVRPAGAGERRRRLAERSRRQTGSRRASASRSAAGRARVPRGRVSRSLPQRGLDGVAVAVPAPERAAARRPPGGAGALRPCGRPASIVASPDLGARSSSRQRLASSCARERAHLALGRPAGAAARAGEAVPGAREAAEVGAAAAAVRGEHRADAAPAIGVGADDDPVVAVACPSSIATRVSYGRQSTTLPQPLGLPALARRTVA